MDDRRAATRNRVNEVGSIAVDEHTSIPCLIFDLSSLGVRLTMLDAHIVPDSFVLSSGYMSEARVCTTVWRTDEEIGACFSQAAA
ncbi:PilZ domain-containing protein [Methylobacterium sp. A54F]